jgi:2-keto-4-pentenoate hydratase/2-oxohepta-3-ene-1,7-dioic acid hydratase in catechol pathway
MRLVTFRSEDGPRLGVLTEGGLVDVADCARTAGVELPPDMRSFIALGDRGLDELEVLLPGAKVQPADDLRLAPPVADLTKNAFAVGRNYLDHIREGSRARGEAEVKLPEYAVFFTKPPSSLIAHGEEIQLHPTVTSNLDYEVELVVVIGRGGRDISAESALDHVYGYTIGNDVSARDLQRAHGQWFKGKSLDRTCPIGPCIVPARYLPDIRDARITLRVNGDTRQDARTSQMIYDIPTIIHQLSQGLTLDTGDLILTGTPSGVGHGMTPPHWLAEGDTVEAEIEGIGVLRNRVAAGVPDA